MKNSNYLKHLSFLFLVCVFSGCSFLGNLDIQKRHYRKGVYVHFKNDIFVPERSTTILIQRSGESYSLQTKLSAIEICDTVLGKDSVRTKQQLKKNKPEFSKKKFQQLAATKAIPSEKKKNSPPPNEVLAGIGRIFLTILVSFAFPGIWLGNLALYMIVYENNFMEAFGYALLIFTIIVFAAEIVAIVLLILGFSIWLPMYLIILGIGLISFILSCIVYDGDVGFF